MSNRRIFFSSYKELVNFIESIESKTNWTGVWDNPIARSDRYNVDKERFSIRTSDQISGFIDNYSSLDIVDNFNIKNNSKWKKKDSEIIKDKMYDGTYKCRLPDVGMKGITGMYARFLMNEGRTEYIGVDHYTKGDLSNIEDFVFCDYEHLGIWRVDLAKAHAPIYNEIVTATKNDLPGKIFGKYATCPIQFYFEYLDSRITTAKKINDETALAVESCDVLFPRLYPQTLNLSEYEKVCKVLRSECKRLFPDRKAYGFITPRFYKRAVPSSLNGAFVPPDIWNEMLMIAASLFDGIIFWSYDLDEYDVNGLPHEWWLKTKEIML